MRALVSLYEGYYKSLNTIKSEYNQDKISTEEAIERASALLMNLNIVIPSHEVFYPEMLTHNLYDLRDQFEDFISKLQQENIITQ
ncbi:MAG: hypothetical protein IJ415_03970 [Clostridia bacterium]|nr:hypothetical protein [Clostridia bacterium]